MQISKPYRHVDRQQPAISTVTWSAIPIVLPSVIKYRCLFSAYTSTDLWCPLAFLHIPRTTYREAVRLCGPPPICLLQWIKNGRPSTAQSRSQWVIGHALCEAIHWLFTSNCQDGEGNWQKEKWHYYAQMAPLMEEVAACITSDWKVYYNLGEGGVAIRVWTKQEGSWMTIRTR